MGKASNRKQERHKQARDRPALMGLLDENRQFLTMSASSFDAGYEAEAKRIAVSLRVLLHDTNQSRSLLSQLGIKEKIRWVDTADPINPDNLLVGHPGLVIMSMKMGDQGGEGSYIAPLGDLPPSTLSQPLKKFEEWWTSVAMRDTHGETWTRKSLVLTLANKEGGAHVDPNLNHKYEQMAIRNGLGWSAGSNPGMTAPFEGNAIAAAVRQVAFEVEKTLAMQSQGFA